MKLETAILAKVTDYYLKGLNCKEIAKLLELSPRTVQRYIKEGDCRKIDTPKTLEQKAVQMHATGWSYSEIAQKLKRSRTTIYLWNKKAKAPPAQ